MKKYILTLVCCAFLYLLQGRAQQTAPQQINWLSFEQLSDSLARKPKPVMVFFHTDWCSYCRKMMSTAFVNPELVNFLNLNYYAVSFDAESADTIYFEGQPLLPSATSKKRGQYHQITQLLAARAGKYSFPTTIILHPDFTVRARFFEYLSPKKLKSIVFF